MKKPITLIVIGLALTMLFTLSFKSLENNKKEYVTIFCNDWNKDLTLSYSDGTYKIVDYQKRQGNGDQTQILKIINEHEMLGYKLVNYDNKSPQSSLHQITSVLMCK